MATTQGPKGGQRPPKKPLDVVGRKRALRACGHEDEFKLLKGEKPEYAARRMEKWAAKRCAPCVEAAQRSAMEEAARKRAEKKGKAKFRLPHGSEFVASYDASKKKWTGRLVVDGATFEGTRDGVHGLLRALGREWRQTASSPAG